MNELRWKFNRLRVMGPREIISRAFQLAKRAIEKLAVGFGWEPFPRYSVKSGILLFATESDWFSKWWQHYGLEQLQLDNLLAGKIHFFGYGLLDVGRPINWHREPSTGIDAPLTFGKGLNYRDDKLVGNIKILWELGRHQSVPPLAVAYICTGESRYRDAVVNQVESWIDENPYGMGIHWCSALEVSLRLISWAIAHCLLALKVGDGGLFSVVSDKEKLGRAVYQQVRFVRNFLSRYSSANNHLIGELTGVWVACCVFDIGKQGDQWAEFAQQELEKEARMQIHSDGVNKEQACYYHLWVLEYLLLAWVVGVRARREFTTEFRDRILAMADFIRAITPTGGRPPQIGDADDGFVTRFSICPPEDTYRESLCVLDAIFRPDSLTESLPQKAFWYSICAGESSPAAYSTAGGVKFPAIFPEGGYAVLKNRKTHVMFDAGPLGYPAIAAHGHADALSLCVALDGLWWLVDPGTYAYHSEQGWRDYFRGTSAHNTLEVDSANQAEIGGPFLWRSQYNSHLTGAGSIGDAQWASGRHDGYRKRAGLHSRTIYLDEEGARIKIIDEVLGKGTHELKLYFHFAPDIAVAQGSHANVWLATRRDANYSMMFVVDETWSWDVLSGSESPILGWFSPCLGTKLAACTLRGSRQSLLPARIETTIVIAGVTRMNSLNANANLSGDL